MHLPFAKYSGCGNDFVLVDNRKNILPEDRLSLVQRFCERRQGIGADGVILLEKSDKADYRMRIYNPDGGEAEMCGNGIRCLMHFIQSLEHQVEACVVETMERLIQLICHPKGVCAAMGDPTDVRWDLSCCVNDTCYQVHHLNTGVPHLVLFVPDLEGIDVCTLGRALRFHTDFQPKGANVNFACLKEGVLCYRTFERGVEGETLACGTGAVAVALAAAHIQCLESPIQVYTRSGEQLEVCFTCQEEKFSAVTMSGPATLVYQGIIELS